VPTHIHIYICYLSLLVEVYHPALGYISDSRFQIQEMTCELGGSARVGWERRDHSRQGTGVLGSPCVGEQGPFLSIDVTKHMPHPGSHPQGSLNSASG
jgi:hypothetical protein